MVPYMNQGIFPLSWKDHSFRKVADNVGGERP